MEALVFHRSPENTCVQEKPPQRVLIHQGVLQLQGSLLVWLDFLVRLSYPKWKDWNGDYGTEECQSASQAVQILCVNFLAQLLV